MKIAEFYIRHPTIQRFKVAMVAPIPKQAIVFRRSLKPSASVVVFSEFATACAWIGVTCYYAERRATQLRPAGPEHGHVPQSPRCDVKDALPYYCTVTFASIDY